MFTEFEKEFLKINQMKKFDLWFWGTCFLTTLINLLLKIFFKINLTTFISIYLGSFLLILFIFLYKAHKKYPKKRMKDIILLSSYQINRKEDNELYNLLKKYKITKKEDIKFLIEHYELKEIMNKPKAFLSKICELIIIILPIIAIFFGENKKYILIKALIIICIYVICYIINNFLIKAIFLGYDIIKNENMYTLLIDELSEIYFNYDKYQKYLR